MRVYVADDATIEDRLTHAGFTTTSARCAGGKSIRALGTAIAEEIRSCDAVVLVGGPNDGEGEAGIALALGIPLLVLGVRGAFDRGVFREQGTRCHDVGSLIAALDHLAAKWTVTAHEASGGKVMVTMCRGAERATIRMNAYDARTRFPVDSQHAERPAPD